MTHETITTVLDRVRALETEVLALRHIVDAEPLGISDRQYLSRCFELLGLELTALRDYLSGIGSENDQKHV